MDEQTWMAERFETHRGRLEQVARRILGPGGEATDAVQEAWLRFSRSGREQVENLGGWLTTVVARICLDMLRARASRREEPGEDAAAHAERRAPPLDPEGDALMADAVGAALMVVLDRLAPAERVAFVLHDVFDVPFEEIGRIVDRSPVAARQLASRARRRVQASGASPDDELDPDRTLVEAFLAASREGDLAGLIALLDGELGVLVAPRGRMLLVLRPTIVDGRIVEIEAVAERASLDRLSVETLAR